MTRDRRFKEVVRARMRRTGESYTAALASVQRVPPPSRPLHRGGSSMYPFERFTEPAKEVLTLAQEEAARAHHSYIGTEHLLLGLLRAEDCVARRALDALGVELAAAREAIQAVLGPLQDIVVVQIVPTSRVKKVIELAFKECQRLGHGHVGTHHLLVGLLIEGEGVAARVLAGMGVTLDHVRTEIDRLLEEGSDERVGPPASGRTAPSPPGSSERQGLFVAAQRLADTPAGLEVLARLVDLRRVTVMKEGAISAQDYQTATRHRTEEQRLRKALEQALTAWRGEPGPAGPPGEGSG